MLLWAFPGGSVGKESTCNAEETGDVGSILGLEDPLEKEIVTCSGIFAWKSHGQRRLVGYSPQDCREPVMTVATEHKHMLIYSLLAK